MLSSGRRSLRPLQLRLSVRRAGSCAPKSEGRNCRLQEERLRWRRLVRGFVTVRSGRGLAEMSRVGMSGRRERGDGASGGTF